MDDVRTVAERLLSRLRRWSADSWARPATPPEYPDPAFGASARRPAGTTRAEVAAAVAQRLADLAADAEGRPRQPVPRLPDTVLADQLAVLFDDVVRAGNPRATAAAGGELIGLSQALGYR